MSDETATNQEPVKAEDVDGQTDEILSAWPVPVPGQHAGIEPQELSQRPSVKGSAHIFSSPKKEAYRVEAGVLPAGEVRHRQEQQMRPGLHESK